MQGDGPSSQGDGNDFSLIDYYPQVAANLSNGPGHATYDAYMAKAPGVYGVTASHYCCQQWASGCPAGASHAPASVTAPLLPPSLRDVSLRE